MTEDQIIDMLTQLAAYLPVWGWGALFIVAAVLWLASKYMRAPTESGSGWYRVLYAVATGLPRLVRKVLERRKWTMSSDGQR